MDSPQKDKFLAELKAEDHGSEDQLRRQNNDIRNGKKVQAGKTKVVSRMPATRRHHADVSSPELFWPLGSKLLC